MQSYRICPFVSGWLHPFHVLKGPLLRGVCQRFLPFLSLGNAPWWRRATVVPPSIRLSVHTGVAVISGYCERCSCEQGVWMPVQVPASDSCGTLLGLLDQMVILR